MFPRMAPIRQRVTEDAVTDPVACMVEQLRALPLAGPVRQGMRVAIGVGSRGIHGIAELVAALAAELRALGAAPFVVPAMGSHGGGTAEGQRAVLEGYGITAAALGVPIESAMDTVVIGETAAGMPVHVDARAARADGLVVINRIKPHTAFRGPTESGLLKMLAVGLGKERGAATIHGWGLAEALPAAAQEVIDRLPVIAGIGIVENGCHRPAHVEVIAAQRLAEREPELLRLAWEHLPRVPLCPLDVLVLRRIGKEISGTGMDLNVVGMWRRTGGTVDPQIRALVALELTPQSRGNGIGVGYADVITQRLRDAVDPAATAKNCLTSGNYNGAKLPITFPSDREAIAAVLPTVEPERARLVIAPSTLELQTLWISEALIAEAEQHPDLELVGPAGELAFDDAGTLTLS